jgi:hypothetical protein
MLILHVPNVTLDSTGNITSCSQLQQCAVAAHATDQAAAALLQTAVADGYCSAAAATLTLLHAVATAAAPTTTADAAAAAANTTAMHYCCAEKCRRDAPYERCFLERESPLALELGLFLALLLLLDDAFLVSLVLAAAAAAADCAAALASDVTIALMSQKVAGSITSTFTSISPSPALQPVAALTEAVVANVSIPLRVSTVRCTLF